MKKREFKDKLFSVLQHPVDGMTYDEKMQYVQKLFINYQKEHEDQHDLSNKGKPWRDEELKIILSDAATAENCLKYAKLFQRGYGSIEQIYRWATTNQKDIQKKRPDDKFILQIKRIVKELELRG